MLNKKTLFIIDAMALAHRCYWVHKDLKTEEGRYTGMVYGAKAFMEGLVERYLPDYMIVVSDAEGPTFRHEMYPEYKANRSEKDPEFLVQKDDFYDLFRKMGIPVVMTKGYEADDLIGTLTTKFASDDLHCYIVSGDKDFMQLVNNNVSLFRPLKYPEVEILGPAQVYNKLGIHPTQVVDYLSLVGDSADNIPGAKGIGPKGASGLLKSYGTLEGVLANLHAVKGANQEKLRKSVPATRLSKQLAAIKRDVEIEGDISLETMAFSVTDLDREEVKEFYRLLKFQEIPF